MLAAHRTSLLLLIAVVATGGSGAAQDPAIDLPHERVAILPNSATEPVAVSSDAPMVPAYVGQGLSLLAAGEDWQAAGSFREVVHRDPDSPIGYLGLALAARFYPRTAAKHVWQAYGRREQASPLERRIIGAYARCYQAEDRPRASEKRYDSAPDVQAWLALRAELTEIAGNHPQSELVARIIELQRRPRANAASIAVIITADGGNEQAQARRPRHPRFDFGSAPWQPRMAPGFDLLRGLGGRRDFELYRGKPVLVVFFLGFG